MSFWTIILLLITLGLAVTVWQLRTRIEALETLNQNLKREYNARKEVNPLGLFQLAGDIVFNGIVLIDQDRRFRYINHAARKLLDITQEGIDETLIALTRNHELNNAAAQAITGQSIEEQPIMIRGRICHLSAKVIQVGADPLIMLVLNDISEHIRLDRARRDVVANISHDIRTPLTTIRLLVDSLLREQNNNQALTESSLEQINQQTERLQRLAQGLIDLAAIEAGRKEARLIPISVAQMLERVKESLHEQARRKDIHIEIDTPETIKTLTDPDQIDRVLGNLLDNAIRYAPEGTQVWIKAHTEGDMVRITVSDEGIGIPRYERERIFERFYRGDRSRSTEGSGLGLAIAKHIVMAHGGEIQVDTEGEGTSISFTLIGD